MRNWRCIIGRHTPITVFDDVDFTSLGTGGAAFTVRGSHSECVWCEKNLDERRRLRRQKCSVGVELWLRWIRPRIETGFAAEDAVYVYFGFGRCWVRWG